MVAHVSQKQGAILLNKALLIVEKAASDICDDALSHHIEKLFRSGR